MEGLLEFKRRAKHEGVRTTVCDVYLIRTKQHMGLIAWHVVYRQYVFRPCDGGVFTARVLQEIKAHMKRMLRAWKERGPETQFSGADYAKAKSSESSLP